MTRKIKENVIKQLSDKETCAEAHGPDNNAISSVANTYIDILPFRISGFDN